MRNVFHMDHWQATTKEKEEEEESHYRGSSGFCDAAPLPTSAACDSPSRRESIHEKNTRMTREYIEEEGEIPFYYVLRERQENLDESPVKRRTNEGPAMKMASLYEEVSPPFASHYRPSGLRTHKEESMQMRPSGSIPTPSSSVHDSHCVSERGEAMWATSPYGEEEPPQEDDTRADEETPLVAPRPPFSSSSFSTSSGSLEMVHAPPAEVGRAIGGGVPPPPVLRVNDDEPREMRNTKSIAISGFPSPLDPHAEEEEKEEEDGPRETGLRIRRRTQGGLSSSSSGIPAVPLEAKDDAALRKGSWCHRKPSWKTEGRGDRAEPPLVSSALSSSGSVFPPSCPRTPLPSFAPSFQGTAETVPKSYSDAVGGGSGTLSFPPHLSQSVLEEALEEEEEAAQGGRIMTDGDVFGDSLLLSDTSSMPSSQRFSRHMPLRDEESMTAAATAVMRTDRIPLSASFSQSSSLLSFTSNVPPHSPSSPLGGRHFSDGDEEERPCSRSGGDTSSSRMWIANDFSYSASLYREKLAENLLLPSRHPSPQNIAASASRRVSPLPLRAWVEERAPHWRGAHHTAGGVGMEHRLHDKGPGRYRRSTSMCRGSRDGPRRSSSVESFGTEGWRRKNTTTPATPSPHEEKAIPHRFLQSFHHDTLPRGERKTDLRSPCPPFPSLPPSSSSIAASSVAEDDRWCRFPRRAKAETAVRGRRRTALRVTHPYRVLEAPSFPTNASQLVDWGSHNRLAIGFFHLFYLWNPVTGEAEKFIQQEVSERIIRLTWVQHGSYVALASCTGVTRVYDGAHGKCLRTLHCSHEMEAGRSANGPVESFGSRPPLFPSSTSLGTTRSATPLAYLPQSASNSSTPSVSSSPDITGLAVRGPLLAVGTSAPEGLVLVYDLRVKEALVQTFHGFQQGAVTTLSYAPTEPFYLATGSADGSVCVWDSRHTQSPRSFSSHVHQGAVSVLQWNPHRSRRLVSGGEDGVLCHLRVFHRHLGAEEEEELPHAYQEAGDMNGNPTSMPSPSILRAHQTGSPISGAIWHPDKEEIVTSHTGENGHLQLRHAKTFQLLRQFCTAGTNAGLCCLTLSPNKVDVCAAQGDETLKMFEVFNEEENDTLSSPTMGTNPVDRLGHFHRGSPTFASPSGSNMRSSPPPPFAAS